VRWEKEQDLGYYVGIESHVSCPHEVPEDVQKAMGRVAERCTVDQTIRNTDDIPVHFRFGE